MTKIRDISHETHKANESMISHKTEKGKRDSPVLRIPAEAANHSSTAGKRKMRESASEYDELDYRLMATFPASDATALY